MMKATLKEMLQRPVDPKAHDRVLFVFVIGALVVPAVILWSYGHVAVPLYILAVTCLYTQYEGHKHFTERQLFAMTGILLLVLTGWGFLQLLVGNYATGLKWVFVGLFTLAAVISHSYFRGIWGCDADQPTTTS